MGASGSVKSFPYLDFFVLIHPLLIMLVAGIMLLFVTGCVRVTHRLPPLPTPPLSCSSAPQFHSSFAARCALVQKLKRQFGNGEIPEELQQAEAICREAGL